ncbi:MAG: hypothetical protein MPEBLZ_03345 [Candidatus Methanoperedens nitroreducens]|uniref:Uncharacterized protein n=1 Tax=Candidatus Methanoperedens nitratireducens TaxID=1392998 RepID=A0A0P8A6B7_9EURY|nr:MAG: hypothetical protein MPEBLZ_03345 [Candidatus Methanoperedens sp. BLZ1]
MLYSTYFIIGSGERKLKFIKNEFANSDPLAIIVGIVVVIIFVLVVAYVIWNVYPPFREAICSAYPANSTWKSWPC